MTSRIKQDTIGKRKSQRVLKNLDQFLKKLDSDLNLNNPNSLHSNQNVEDKDFAKAAIRLIISSSRKDFITLCTKVALILKENHELRKEMIVQSESLRSLSKVNKRSRTVQNYIEDNQQTITAEVHKPRQEKSPKDVLGDDNSDVSNFLPVLKSLPDASHRNISKIKHPTIKSSRSSDTAELSKQDRSTLETISSESSENLSENVIQPKNETRKAVQFWKNKYFKQNHRIVELEKEKKNLEGQITFLVSAKSTNKESDALSMEIEPVTEPRKYRGWERLLERLHDIPLLAPVPLQGCKCSQCECMFNPIYYSDFKDAKMYKLLSNSAPLLRIGDLVLIPGDRICQVSYIGHLDEPGLLEAVFVGLILKRPEGCCDGVHRGRRYFTCGDGCGLFLPINWIILIVGKARP